MSKIDNNTWTQIKTDYQLGMGIRDLERKYKVAASSISTKKSKEGWNQEANKKFQLIQNDMNSLEQNVQSFEQEFEQHQMPYVEHKLDEVLRLRKTLNTFIAVAMEDNLKDLLEVRNEPDLINRVNLRARMRANMLDLKELVNTEKVQALDVEEEKDNEIVFRLE